MSFRKINALLAIMSVLFMILHIGYNIFSYLTMYYNPSLKLLTAIPFIVCVCLHAIFGMCALFFLGDGTRLDIYTMQNRQTLIQRISAALFFPLLIIHLKTFDFLKALSEGRNWAVFVLVILIQILFYAIVIAHAAVSLPKALITLGILGRREKLKAIEKISYLVGLVLFVAVVFAVIRGEIAIFIP